MIEETFENLSDNDLEFLINEIYKVEKQDKEVSETMMLNNLINTLDDAELLPEGLEFTNTCMLCMREYSYRKAGLK